MATTTKPETTENFSKEELRPEHERAIRSLVHLMKEVLSTNEEDKFFEGSAEAMRLCASIIKQSKFSQGLTGQEGIPYADQALEYSMDVLQEHMAKAKVVSYDN